MKWKIRHILLSSALSRIRTFPVHLPDCALRAKLQILILPCLLSGNCVLVAQTGDTAITVESILEMSLEEMFDTEVTSATKTRQNISDVPANTRVITSAEILENGYQTLEEALERLPGFQFRDIQGFNSYTFQRGIPSQNNYILLLVDGVQVNELNSGGFYGGGQYNMSNIERIEVVYGPSSALYGTNAVSGIVNLITKKTHNRHSARVSAVAGGFATRTIDFGYGHSKNDFGFGISGMYRTTEKADLAGEKGDNNWTDEMENFEHNHSVSGYLTYKDLSAGVNYFGKQSSRTTNYESIDNIYLDRGTLWDIYFLNAYVQHAFKKGDKLSNQARAYFRDATVRDRSIGHIIKADTASMGEQAGYYRPSRLAGFEDQINFRAGGKLDLTGGVVLEHEWLSEDFSITYSNSEAEKPPRPGKPARLENNLLSIYLQAQYRIVRELILTAGARQDLSSYYGTVFTPRVGLVFNKNNFTGKLLYNEAFRAPRPWDYTYGTGNDDLDPEKMKSAELYLSYRLPGSLLLDASVYRYGVSGTLVRDIDRDRWVNENRVDVTGVELGINYSREKVKFYGFYTYSSPWDQNGNFLPEISEHTASTGITFTPWNVLIVHLRGNYYGQKKNPRPISATGTDIVDDALVLRGNIGYRILGMNIQLIVNNILDSEYYHTSNLMPERYRQPQRQVLLRLTYRFNVD